MNMKFSLLLLGLWLKLRHTAKRSPSFRSRLKERNFTLQIKTGDNTLGRYYVFSDGEVFSKKGIHSQPDVALVWSSPVRGFRVMKSGDRAAAMRSRESGELRVEGDPMLAIWFTETISQLRDVGGAKVPPAAREERVAVIGLGNMGRGIALNLMRAGFKLTVYNRTESKTQPFTDAGAVAARSPKEAAAGADIVITSLMGDDSVFDVVEGESGLLDGLKPGAIHIGASTVSPQCSARLARMHSDAGSRYVAAPVLGRPDVAAAGDLVALVSGDPDAIDKCRTVFSAYTRVVRVIPGEQRLANVVKLCANYTGAATIELMGQVYAFAEKSGVELGVLEELFRTTWAHPGLKDYATRIRSRDFDSEDGFALSGGLKDIQLMMDSSEAVGAGLDYCPIIKRKMLEGMDAGMSRLDWSGTYEITRRHAGLP